MPLLRSRSPAITHGAQLTLSDVGPVAGGYLLESLTEVSGTHWLTDYTAGGTGGSEGDPKVVEGYHFTGDVIFDADWITLRGCLLDNPTTAYLGGIHNVGARLEYCTISPATVGDECMKFESWSAYRCYFRGCSDGAKVNGGAQQITLTECYVRVKMASADDHNDTLQNVGGDGTVVVERCNLSVDPEGGLLTGGSGGPNSVIQSADLTAGSVFFLAVRDSLLDGTNALYTLRLYDGGLTTNITYEATGNRFIRSGTPLDRGSSNTTPTGQITWSGNVFDDDDESIPLA